MKITNPLLLPFLLLLIALVLPQTESFAQPDFYSGHKFTKKDTLRGMLLPERTCYDVKYYELDIQVDPENKSIGGSNLMRYKIVEDFMTLQVDLWENMQLDKIIHKGKELKFDREFDAVFIRFPEVQKKGLMDEIRMYYHGKPVISKNPPWSGGFVWSKDKAQNHWVGVSCEGDGASLWWPNKDHLSDEPDSMSIICTVPANLQCVANGNLRKKTELRDNKTRFHWFVSYPINNYNVTLNIADYAHFSEEYKNKDGTTMPLDYYVLKANLEKAKVHFKSVPMVLESFEHYFGKYPFWNDGFALVETPYLGMEHQSAIAYGNKYMKGYMGFHPPGFEFDYIIVHEAGHEWFGNSISCRDLAEMWIHESFTTYMESLYVEYTMGYESAVKYLQYQKNQISNREPIIGPMNVNWEDWEGGDHYNKGAWVLHTLRNTMENDQQWFDLLKSFYTKFEKSNITTEDFVEYVNKFTGKNYTSFFNQYLRYPRIPVLEFKINKKGKDILLEYRWIADVNDFNMPVKVGKQGNYFKWLKPTTEWQTEKLENMEPEELVVPTEYFLIRTKLSK